MKTRLAPLAASLSLLSLLAVSLAPSLPAQTAPGAAPDPNPAPPPPPSDAPVEHRVEKGLKDAARGAGDAKRSTPRAAQAVHDIERPAFQFGSGAPSSSRSLALLNSPEDSQKIDDIEEDLSVMARILQKAARGSREDDRNNAMGILVGPFVTASGARNLYLEGNGAVFLLTVRYPLVGSPERAQNSEWEDTLNEIRGRDRRSTKVEAFDEQRVEGLKSALLEALENHASKIRGLNAAEHVTVVVQGGDVSEETVKVYAKNDGNAMARAEVRIKREVRTNGDPSSRQGHSNGESVLNIRVKKSDIDAHAAGTLSAAEFRQRANVQTYLRRSEPARSARR